MIITKETHSQFPFQNSIDEKLGIATSGTASYTDGQIGRAFTNSATSGTGIGVGNSSSYNHFHQNGVGCFSFWVKITNNASKLLHTIADNSDLNTGATGFLIAYDNRQLAGGNFNITKNAIRFGVGKGSSGNPVAHINCKDAIMDNDWHHVLWNFNGNTGINDVYVDTILMTDNYFQNSPAYSSGGGGNALLPMRISTRSWTGTAIRFRLLGSLQHLTFFKKTLNISDIKRVYNGLHPLI
jgi:hypothetical protein